MFWNSRPTEYDAESAWKKWTRFLVKFTANANGKFRLLFFLSNRPNSQISSNYNKRRYFYIIARKAERQTKLKRVQRKKYRDMQAKLFVHWDEYQQGKKSTSQLLRSCSYLNGPRAN